jgi:biopolymer transport protein ExbB
MVARLHAQRLEPEAIASAITRALCVLIIAAAGVAASSAVNAQDQLPPIQGTAVLPRDLSPWGMFMNADVVVKVVMEGTPAGAHRVEYARLSPNACAYQTVEP